MFQNYVKGGGITLIQSIVGALLHYSRSIDKFTFHSLKWYLHNASSRNKRDQEKCKCVLDYPPMYPYMKLRFNSSGMQLHIDSDTSLLVVQKARSRVAGYYTFPNTKYSSKMLTNTNHPVLVECRTFRHVVVSCTEVEATVVFHDAQSRIHSQRILIALEYQQNVIPITRDNSVDNVFIRRKIHLRNIKTWDIIG